MDRQRHLRQAVLWESLPENKVKCNLCCRNCEIKEGELGACFVRKNIDGKLYSLNYNRICAANPDPIEKKPLFHFQPGKKSFSIAAVGCNFRCRYCQNWQISQVSPKESDEDESRITPNQIVEAAVKENCSSIAYTYTEPTIFMELCNDCAKLAKQKGLANVFVSNGYMTKQAIDFTKGWLDAINIDLKAFTEEYYQYFCRAKLQPVLDTIKYIAKETDIWMEITTLVVPGQNDSDKELNDIARFICEEAGENVPWHISRFYPQYKYQDSEPTPLETLEKAYEIGKQAGLKFVYVGNVRGANGANTHCPNCGELLIERVGFYIRNNNLEGGRCPDCGAEIPGVEM